MTSPEFDRLADLIDALCPAAPDELRISRNKRVAVAYWYALSPYEYRAAREGVLSAARKSRLYPSVSEIVAGMPPPPPRETEERPRNDPQQAAWMRRYILRNAERAKRGAERTARHTEKGEDA